VNPGLPLLSVAGAFKFGMGDGILNYYLYNYALAANNGFVESKKIGVVLI
jgi:hypothetical protein